MATYKEKVGTAVVNYAGDYPGAVEGELWYDSTNKDFKYQYPNVTSAGAWRTGGNMNTARNYLGGCAADNTAAIGFGGNPGNLAITELYDGTSWTEVNDLNTGRDILTGTGTSTSGLGWGDEPPSGKINGISRSQWEGWKFRLPK